MKFTIFGGTLESLLGSVLKRQNINYYQNLKVIIDILMCNYLNLSLILNRLNSVTLTILGPHKGFIVWWIWGLYTWIFMCNCLRSSWELQCSIDIMTVKIILTQKSLNVLHKNNWRKNWKSLNRGSFLPHNPDIKADFIINFVAQVNDVAHGPLNV